MVKRAGNLYMCIAEPDNLRLAFHKAAKGKRGNVDVRGFEADLDANLTGLREELLAGNVQVGQCHTFTVFDPKERLICAAAFRERVLHHAIMNVCHAVFEAYQTSDSYASRIGKGTYAALYRAQALCCRYRWFAKLDVRKYFDSIAHEVVLALLRRRFKDRRLLTLFERIIGCYHTVPRHGLPIGNLTSQYFANHLLAVADHYVREQLGVCGYVRYMDDMVLWADERDQLQIWVTDLCACIEEQLDLRLKPVVMNRTAHGLPFLGYIVRSNGIRLSCAARGRYTGRLRQAYGKLIDGEWSQKDFQRHVMPLIGYTDHADAREFRRRVMADIYGTPPRGVEPREPRRQLEQHGQELPLGQSQQEHSGQREQQPGVPRRPRARSSEDGMDVRH